MDLRPEMLELAAEWSREQGVEVEWIAADMRDFRLDRPVDVAINMFDGLDALLTNQDLVHHFRAIAGNLTPGGLYVIECTHPRDCSMHEYGEFRYGGSRDGVDVRIRWAIEPPVVDIVAGTAEVVTEMEVDDNGQPFRIVDRARERFLMPQEIALLAERSGALEVVAWHGDFDLDQPLDLSPRSRRMIAVLRKGTGADG
jgi:hypothetical protein